MRHLLLLLFLLGALRSAGQAPQWPNPEIEMVYQRGREAMAKGAIRPAAALFRQVVDAAPEVPEGRRELAGALQLGGAPLEALDVLEPLFKARTADPQCYRIGIAAWKSAGRPDNAENLVKTGLKRHPKSGLMHYEAGRWEDGQGKTADALEAWTEGIAADPGYYLNYYEAARSYSGSSKLVWCLLYGETFLLFENQTPRAAETRKMLLEAYRRFFFPSAADEQASSSERRNSRPGTFEEAVVYTLRRAGPVVADGVTTENLTMLRARFLAEWADAYAGKYPYALFAYQDAVIREGHFDAYTMQLFGRAEREAAYDAWVQFHPDAISDYTAWAAKHPFDPSAGGFYNDGKVKGIFLGDRPGKR